MNQVTHNEDSAHPVTLENATFKWSNGSSDSEILQSLSLHVPDGALVSSFGQYTYFSKNTKKNKYPLRSD